MATTDMNAQIHIKDGNGNVNNIFPATKIENVEGLQTALNAKANSSDVTSGLAGKVDKETGKGLSTNDYTTTEKNKLAGIEAQANKTVVDNALSASSTNPVQNAIVTAALDEQNSSLVEGLATKADNSTVSALTSRVSDAETDIATQTARIDNIVALPSGSTQGDAELIDIRTKADGTTASSAGNAVREQIVAVNNKIIDISGDAKIIEYSGTTHSSAGFVQKDIGISGIAGDKFLFAINSIAGIDASSFKIARLYTYSNADGYTLIGYTTMYGRIYEFVAEKNFGSIRIFIETTENNKNVTVNAICNKIANSNIVSNIINNITDVDNKTDDIGFLSNAVRNFQEYDPNANSIVNTGFTCVIPELLTCGSVAKVEIPIEENHFNIQLLVISEDKKVLDIIQMPYSNDGISKLYVDTAKYEQSVYFGFVYNSGTKLYFMNYNETALNIHKPTWIEGTSFNVGDTVAFIDSTGYQSYRINIDYVQYAITNNYERKTPSVVTVGKTGCDYTTINEALNGISDSSDNPITILLYPGVYEEVCNIGGNRHVSIIGVNRDKCIIKDTSGKYANAPIRIGGDFTLANLTVIATAENADPSWSPTGYNPEGPVVLDYPSYALHIDDSDNTEPMVYGYVRNCKFYSECFHAVGIGLHNEQTLCFENCEIIRNTTREDFFDSDYLGAIGVHSTLIRPETEQHIIMKSCEIINNKEKAIQLYHYYPDSPMDCTFIGCTLEDMYGISNVVHYKGADTVKSHYITNRSHGNSTQELDHD